MVIRDEPRFRFQYKDKQPSDSSMFIDLHQLTVQYIQKIGPGTVHNWLPLQFIQGFCHHPQGHEWAWGVHHLLMNTYHKLRSSHSRTSNQKGGKRVLQNKEKGRSFCIFYENQIRNFFFQCGGDGYKKCLKRYLISQNSIKQYLLYET